MKFAARLVLFTFISIVCFAGVAAAADVAGVPDAPGLWELAQPVLTAVMRGSYLEGVALALVLLAAITRRYAPWGWVKTDAGGAALVLVGSFGGAAATALATGAAPSLALAWTAAKVAFAAAGGYSMAKRLAVPAIEWIAVRAPSWTRPLFDTVLWIFGRSTAIAAAERAGDAAVASSPATGAGGVVGNRVDVP